MISFRKGFTVLEVLIVVALFGLMVALGLLSIRSAHARARDAQRLYDIEILRSALRQHWLERATYPTSAGVLLGSPGTNTDIFTREGFSSRGATEVLVYLDQVPVGPTSNEYYRYKGGSNGYSIRFQTESETAYGKANVYYAHASGIDGKDEEK
jgi:prepilin-type N-terminal cleavage/methylation domain-containing protein